MLSGGQVNVVRWAGRCCQVGRLMLSDGQVNIVRQTGRSLLSGVVGQCCQV